MPTNAQRVINSHEVRDLVADGFKDWRSLVKAAVTAYERIFDPRVAYVVSIPNRHAPDAEHDRHVEKVWRTFWVPIFENLGLKVPGPFNAISTDEFNAFLEQLKRELSDAHSLMRNVSIIYSEVTGHQVSKPMTDPYVVAQLAREHFEEYEKQDVWEWFDSIVDEEGEGPDATVTIAELRQSLEGHYGVRVEA